MFGEAMARARARARRPRSGSTSAAAIRARSRARFRSIAASRRWRPRAIRSSGAAGRCTPTAGSRRRTARRISRRRAAARAPRALAARRSRLPRLDAPRQAVQLDGAARVDPLTGAARDAVLMSEADILFSASGRRPRRLRSTSGSFHGKSAGWRPSNRVTLRSTGRKATRCCQATPSIRIRWSRITTRLCTVEAIAGQVENHERCEEGRTGRTKWSGSAAALLGVAASYGFAIACRRRRRPATPRWRNSGRRGQSSGSREGGAAGHRHPAHP